MIIYSENELLFYNGIFSNLNHYEKNQSIVEQLHSALLKKQQGCGSYPFNSLSPIPKTILKGFNWPIEFIKLADWIFFKLWTQIGIIDYKTMEVRLRISSNMLEKLFLQNIITKDEFIWLDMNLKLNVTNLWVSIVEKDLPF